MYIIYVYHYGMKVVVALCKPYIGIPGVYMTLGGSRGVQGTPPGPQRGGPGPLFQNEENSIYYLQFKIFLIDLQIDLGEKQKHIYLLCELHKITSRKYEGMFLLEKK